VEARYTFPALRFASGEVVTHTGTAQENSFLYPIEVPAGDSVQSVLAQQFSNQPAPAGFDVPNETRDRAFLNSQPLQGQPRAAAERTDASVCRRFTRLTPIISFQLVRFRFNLSTIRAQKVLRQFTFPALLVLDALLNFSSDQINVKSLQEPDEAKEANYVYTLRSVIVHSGTAQGGHYWHYSYENGVW